MSEALGKKIVNFAQSKVGRQVGTGECFDLAAQVLKSAGAKSADSFGKVPPDADYVWGDPVTVDKTLARDIIQFRDCKGDVTKEKEISLAFPGGEKLTYYENLSGSGIISYKHHTAVASAAIMQGSLSVLEQNVDRTGNGILEQIVRPRELYLKSRPVRVVRLRKKTTINQTWAKGVKRSITNPAQKKFIDDLVKNYGGRAFNAKIETTVKA